MSFITKIVTENQPEVEFSVSTQGCTIYSPRFYEPRFLEWDVKGKCGKCASSALSIDFYINMNGVEINSQRLSAPRFVLFDLPIQLPEACFFRVRMKGHTFNIPFKINENKIDSNNVTNKDEMNNSIVVENRTNN